MRRIMMKIMFYFGFIVAVLGASCIDSECSWIFILISFFGIGIAYLNRSVYYEYYRKYDKEL